VGEQVKLCAFDDLIDGASRGFDPFQQGLDTVFVIRRGESAVAFRNACPHDGESPMAWRKDAYLNAARDRIVCYAHGATFDIQSGECLLGPCVGQYLTRVAVSIDGDRQLHMTFTD